MNQLEVQMEQGGANERRHTGFGQLPVPDDQGLQQHVDVPTELRRPVAATVGDIADVGGHCLSVVPQLARPVILVDQPVCNLPVDGADKIQVRMPTLRRSGLIGHVTRQLDVLGTALLFFLDLRRLLLPTYKRG